MSGVNKLIQSLNEIQLINQWKLETSIMARNKK